MTGHLEDRDVARLAAGATSAEHPHLETCEACRSRVEEERRWLGRMAPLAREAEPERDLWPGIAGALAGAGAEPTARSTTVPPAWRRPRPWLQVAAAAVLLLVGFTAGRFSLPAPPSSPATVPATTASAAEGGEPAGEVQRAGTAYVAALGELRRRAGTTGAHRSLEAGSEVAAATLYGAIVELSRLTDDADVAQLLESAEALRRNFEPPPPPPPPGPTS